MSKELIEQIAFQVVNQEILQNWKVYIVLIALVFITTAFSTFFVSYFKERGKNFATSADINRLMEKLENTTTLTETIKAEISDDFGYKAKCRDKLEDLFELIYQYEAWHPAQTAKAIKRDPVEVSGPIAKIELLVSIYFPRCKTHIEHLKLSDISIVAFNLELESGEKKFDGLEFMECMEPVKKCCEKLRISLLECYEDELRL